LGINAADPGEGKLFFDANVASGPFLLFMFGV